jgi:hypothetical protein
MEYVQLCYGTGGATSMAKLQIQDRQGADYAQRHDNQNGNDQASNDNLIAERCNFINGIVKFHESLNLFL